MEQRISLITLGVNDLDRSRAFYERLGWRRSVKGAEGVAFFQTGGMALALWPRTDLAKDANLPAEGSGFCGLAIAHNTRSKREVDEVLAQAGRAGAAIVRAARDTFYGGYAGYFADPDGFLWEVAWNPGFAMDAEGNIELPE
jgi:catechol 2,3-dioxygenase-like lactoylglutathione lyase family enzyme